MKKSWKEQCVARWERTNQTEKKRSHRVQEWERERERIWKVRATDMNAVNEPHDMIMEIELMTFKLQISKSCDVMTKWDSLIKSLQN